jgi:hypothetical protein
MGPGDDYHSWPDKLYLSIGMHIRDIQISDARKPDNFLHP